MPSIRRLDQTVVNRIAAGEIIHRPANALKELIETSLDAGSSNQHSGARQGRRTEAFADTGQRMWDKGTVDRREDMAIVCERFTTSKLKSFDDLESISTYGFRGEALASISHVAHVTITTKTADSKCAFRASYSDGKLVSQKPGMSAEPKPTAGNNGTQITAEDLFYNVPSRRKALKNPGDEYNRILDVVTRYAVHNSGVNFSCKKVSTNNRAVESTMLKKMIENVYITLLPKGSHPFIYLSLEINPQNVDVNVHPTKREVHFLNEDSLIEAIADILQERLAGANDSRTFYTQTLLPGATQVNDDVLPKLMGRVSENKFVRTDSKLRTLDNFLHVSKPANDASDKIATADVVMQEANSTVSEGPSSLPPIETIPDRERVEVCLTSLMELRKEVKKDEHRGLSDVFADHTFVGIVDDALALIQHQANLYMVNYAVIRTVLSVVLREVLNFGYINMSAPIPIKDFIMVALDEEEAQNGWPSNMKPKDEIAQSIANLLVERAEMLHEYFSIKISDNGELLSLPMLIKNYVPTMDKLPLFLLRLGTEVDWDSEKGCFNTMAKELALFFSAEPPLREDSDMAESNANEQEEDRPLSDADSAFRAAYEKEHKTYRWQVENLIFPALKYQFAAPKSLAASSGPGSGHVVQLANLRDLYKIFGRC
ncbi:DNA mismatch repair protein [Umbelopsis nana]